MEEVQIPNQNLFLIVPFSYSWKTVFRIQEKVLSPPAFNVIALFAHKSAACFSISNYSFSNTLVEFFRITFQERFKYTQ